MMLPAANGLHAVARQDRVIDWATAAGSDDEAMIRLFRVFVPTSVVGLLLTETAVAFACYLAAVYLIEDIGASVYLLYEAGLTRVAIVVLSLILGLYFNDLYSDFRVRSRTFLVQQFCLVVGVAFLAQALLSYVYPQLILPRWQMIIGSGLVLVVLPVWRIAYSPMVLRLMGSQRILFLGNGDLVRAISRRIVERPEYGFACIGHLAAEPDPDAGVAAGPYLGPPSQVREIYHAHKPDLIVVGLGERRGQMPVYELLELRLAGVRIEDAASLHESVMGRVSVRALRPSHLLFSSELGPNPRHVQFQRYYSFLIALAGTIITVPAMIGVAVLIRLTSSGPVIYRQSRVGLKGKVFELYKFRSMYVDAEARTGAVWASPDDPRTTPVGRWLRRLRLDELPQFFNVLKGDMAIVGPRPERPEFVQALSEQIPFYGQRHAILPGITGWAQINHKYGDTVEDTVTKLEYDLYYLKNLSFSLDFYIIFQTVKVMLLSRGAQ
jgi:sugar transferase (PEP-CTERM system associated)